MRFQVIIFLVFASPAVFAQSYNRGDWAKHCSKDSLRYFNTFCENLNGETHSLCEALTIIASDQRCREVYVSQPKLEKQMKFVEGYAPIVLSQNDFNLGRVYSYVPNTNSIYPSAIALNWSVDRSYHSKDDFLYGEEGFYSQLIRWGICR